MTLAGLEKTKAFLRNPSYEYKQFVDSSVIINDSGLFVAILESLANESESESNLRNREKSLPLDDERADETPPGFFEGLFGLPQTRSVEETFVKDIAEPTSSGARASGLVKLDPPDLEEKRKNDPLLLALAHSYVKELHGRKLNIFEASFVLGPEGDKGEYLLNLGLVFIAYFGAMVLVVILFLSIYRSAQEHNLFFEESSGEPKRWRDILAVNVVGFIYLMFLTGRNAHEATSFGAVLRKLSEGKERTKLLKEHHRFCLTNNYVINVLLGQALLCINPIFVMSADSPTEAFLNVIAVAFVLDLDDVIPTVAIHRRNVKFFGIPIKFMKPTYWIDWNQVVIHDRYLDLVDDFIKGPRLPKQEVVVVKEKGHHIVLKETFALCYFFVDKRSSTIHIFQKNCTADGDGGTGGDWMFDEVSFRVSGPGTETFLDAVTNFECAKDVSSMNTIMDVKKFL